MKKKKFPLEKVMKYRSYLEKYQAARFRDAMKKESAIESLLTTHRFGLKKKNKMKDKMISQDRLDIKSIKSIQEEILFAEIDENVMERELVKASESRESERTEWLTRKSKADAMKKLKEKFRDDVNQEEVKEEQKDVDEIARQKYIKEGKTDD